MPVLFEGGDPEFEEEKPDVSEVQVKRGQKLIRVGLLMLVLGLLMCMFFIILVVAVVPSSLSDSVKEQVDPNQVRSIQIIIYLLKSSSQVILLTFQNENTYQV